MAGKAHVVVLTNAALVLPLAYEWQNESHGKALGVTVDARYGLADLARRMTDPSCVVLGLVTDDEVHGFMSLQEFASPLGPERMMNEHFFYVGAKHRGIGSMRLLKAAREVTKQRGCSHLLLSASHVAAEKPDRVCKLYEKIGAKPFETTMIVEV